MLDGLHESGRALVVAHLASLDDWSARDLHLLRQAGEARDRQVAIGAAIAASGVVIEGRPSPLLRAERQAAGMVLAALKAIDIRSAPAPASKRA